jgi:addiction module HigA family antidote
MTIRREDLDAGLVDLSDVIDHSRPRMKPVTPGKVLKDEYLDPLGITAYRLAKDIGVPQNRILGILAGRRAITADTALRLARYFGTDVRSWINLQSHFDLETARRTLAKRIDREVKPRAA